MKSIYQEERQRSKRLRKQNKDLILKELTTDITPYWLISFLYTDNKTKEDETLRDVADLKYKTRRIANKNRDRSIKELVHFPIQEYCSSTNRVIKELFNITPI